MAIYPEGEPPVALPVAGGVFAVNGAADLSHIRQVLARAAAERSATALDNGQPLLSLSSERLGVVFSELAGNALRHGAPPVTVSLGRLADGWLISVDDSSDAPPRLRPPSPDLSGGNGLRLVLVLSRTAGWRVLPEGKTVWAEIGDEPPEGLVDQIVTARRRAVES